jgi:tetratricopeptide (TPR) repeat protein
MFGRLKLVRMKAAEDALRDGRLDEAFRMATADDVRDDRRAGKLLKKLADAFWDRARAHYDEGRYSEALIDLEKSARAGRDRTEVSVLSSEVRAAAHQSQHRRKDRDNRLAAARGHIDEGELTMGRRVLEPTTPDDAEAKRLRDAAAARDRQAAEDIEHARKLLKDNQVDGAIDRCRRAASLDANDAALRQLEADLVKRIVGEVHEEFAAGRVDRAGQRLAILGDVGASDAQRIEAAELVERARRVGRLCQRRDYAEALREVQRLRRLAPKAGWLKEVEDKLTQVDRATDALLAGPIGMMVRPESAAPPSPPREGSRPVRVHRTPPAPTELMGGGSLPDRLLVLVDGAGSYLLVRKDRATIGRLSAPRCGDADASAADIALLADIASEHAEIARVEDDYFAVAKRELFVNGRPVSQAMLADGDRLRVGRSAELTFRVPSRRSASAVLDLAGRARMGGDVRRVILFSGHVMIGAGRSCHVRVPTAARELVLFERGGGLYVRAFAARPEERFNGESATPIVPGRHVEIEGIGISIKPWEVVAA